METANCPRPPRLVTPQTLTVFEQSFPNHPIVLSALADAKTGHLNYGTLANLAALADQSHTPALAQAVLEIFATMSSGQALVSRQARSLAAAH